MRNRPPKYDIGPVLESLGAELPAYTKGGWQPMRCFAHEDRHPSATVNFDLNRFYCWSCGLNEDAVGLMRSVHGLDFTSAVRETQRLSPAGDEPVRGNDSSWRGLFGG